MITDTTMRSAALTVVIFSFAAICGCESIVPRDDLQVLARALPTSAEVTTDQREQMAATIRDGTGVESFEFSDFTFVSETRLPSGTGWIIGLFLAGADRP